MSVRVSVREIRGEIRGRHTYSPYSHSKTTPTIAKNTFTAKIAIIPPRNTANPPSNTRKTAARARLNVGDFYRVTGRNPRIPPSASYR